MPGTSFFIISEGTADVVVDGKVVRTLRAGSCCGGLSAMGASRSAAVQPPARQGGLRMPRCSNSSVTIRGRGAVPRQSTAGCRCDGAASSEHLSAYGMALQGPFPWRVAKQRRGGWLACWWVGRPRLFRCEGEVVDEKQNVLCRWTGVWATRGAAVQGGVHRHSARPWQAALRRSRGQHFGGCAKRGPRLRRSRRARRSSPAPPPKPDLQHFATCGRLNRCRRAREPENIPAEDSVSTLAGKSAPPTTPESAADDVPASRGC